MFSLSISKRKAAKAAAAQQQAQQRREAAASAESSGEAGSPLSGKSYPSTGPSSHADELGRVSEKDDWRGRFKNGHSRSAVASSLPLSPPPSSTKVPRVPPLRSQWHFLPTHIPPAHSRSDDDLPWGFIPTRPDVVLGLADIGLAVTALTSALVQRALETPLLFSSLALDISAPTIASLIDTFLATLSVASNHLSPREDPSLIALQSHVYISEPRQGTTQFSLDRAWSDELVFAGERELAWVLRWVLARALQVRLTTGATDDGPPTSGLWADRRRGLVNIECYLHWKEREQAAGYPAVHWFSFTACLDPDLQPIFNDIFSLCSRLAAHSHIGGCTPSVLGSLFGPLLFGIPPSSPVYETHAAFTRSALATEHLLLAFIRSQAHASASHASILPGRLQACIAGYPAMITTAERALDVAGVRPGVKTVKVEGLRRDVRSYSHELFRTAESWPIEMEIAEGSGRPDVLRTWVDRVVEPSQTGSAIHPAFGPRFGADFKRRLHIPAHLPAHSTVLIPGVSAEATFESEGEDEADASFRSISEKQWGDFLTGGFDGVASPSTTSLGSVDGKGSGGSRNRRGRISKQLEFDLTESARKAYHEKRDTLSWADFFNAGFSRTENTLIESLTFSTPIQKDIQQWPEHRLEVHRRLQKLQKDLPSFDYNTRPRYVGELLIEEPFLDCWADLLISTGWMDRSDTTLHECNWAIVAYRAVPALASYSTTRSPNGGDPDTRTDVVHFFFEEIVPVEYQNRLTAVKKPTLGLFSTKRSKKATLTAIADNHGGRSLRDLEEDFAASILRGRPTKLLSLTSSRGQQASSRSLDLVHCAEPSAMHSPAASGLPTTFLTPQKQQTVYPSRSIGDQRLREATPDRRPLSPISPQRVTNKKEARRIQGESPFDPDETNFEMRLASSSPNGTLCRAAAKAYNKEASRDDVWIDIFVSSATRGMAVEQSSVRPMSARVREPFVPPSVPPPPPPLSRPHPERLIPPEASPTENLSRFHEGSSSEVGSLGASTTVSDPDLLPRAPAILVTATSVTARSSDNGLNSRSAILDQSRVDSQLIGDDDANEGNVDVDNGLTRSERLRMAVNIVNHGEYGDQKTSVASDFTQPDSDVLSYLDDATPRTSVDESAVDVDSNPALDIPSLSTTSSYVHGQPLHNLIEEDEEE